jgi:hypothetical protein
MGQGPPARMNFSGCISKVLISVQNQPMSLKAISSYSIEAARILKYCIGMVTRPASRRGQAIDPFFPSSSFRSRSLKYSLQLLTTHSTP